MVLDSHSPKEPRPPSALFVEQLRAARQRKGWSQERLSEEMDRIGFPMDRSVIVKIERKVRNVSLDEAIGFAVALGVSPVSLLLPRHDDFVSLAPRVDMPTWEAENWFLGLFPLPQHDRTERDRRFFAEEASDARAAVVRRLPALWALFQDVSLALRSAAESPGVVPGILESIQQDLPGVLRSVRRHLTKQSATKTKRD